MEAIVKCYSSNIKRLFEVQAVLKVHSTYKNTINIAFDNRVFSIHHREIPLTPMSIILDLDQNQFNHLIGETNKVEIKDKKLIINNFTVKVDEADQINLSLEENHVAGRLDQNSLKKFYSHLFDYLAALSRHSDFFSPTFSGEDLNDYFLSKIVKLIKEKDPNKIGRKMIDLIGLGKGLTPSGDDVVCGILASLGFMGDQINKTKFKNITKNLKNALDDPNITNVISREFIIYALDGYHSELIKKLYQAIANQKNVEQILETISNQGFSSGIDFLTGMYIGHLIGGNLK